MVENNEEIVDRTKENRLPQLKSNKHKPRAIIEEMCAVVRSDFSETSRPISMKF